MAANQHWLNETLKSKSVKAAFIILLYSIVVFVLFILIKSLLGYDVNIWGLHTNPKQETTIIHDTSIRATVQYIHDTPTTAKPNPPHSIKKADTEHSKKNNQYFDNKAPNYGMQGNGNTQNIYGPIQEHPDVSTLNSVMKAFPNKGDSIDLEYANGSKVSAIYASELESLLKAQGYYNVETISMFVNATFKKGIWPYSKKTLIIQAE